MTILAILVALAAIPLDYYVWVRLDRAGHFIIGGLVAGATHATLLLLAYTCWTTT